MKSVWQAAPGGYRLRDGKLSARLRVDGPSLGLVEIVPPIAAARGWPGPLLSVAAVQAAGERPWRVGSPGRRAVHRLRSRGVDLELEASARCAARLHLYWQATSSSQLDLEVLTATSSPYERLEVLTVSRVPTAEVLVPADATGRRWAAVPDAASLGARWLIVPRDCEAARLSLDDRTPRFGELAIAAPFRQPLALLRPARQQWSYVEMSRRDDCSRILVRANRRSVELRFGLFGLDLEKGVILRGRVRGVFVPREHDTTEAMERFAEFCGEPPHLGV